MKIRTFSNTSLIICDKIRQKIAPLQKNPSFYFVLFKKCPTFAPAIGNKPPHGALDEWLSQRSAKPSTPVRIGYAPPKKKTQPFKLSLFCLFSGDGGSRTLVQTRKPYAFYMLILAFDFRDAARPRPPTAPLSSKVSLAARGGCQLFLTL